MSNNDADQWAQAGTKALQDDTAQQIRNNVQATSGTSADQAAQYQHLAKFINVPLGTVQQDPAAIKAQYAVQQTDADTLASDTPHVAKYLTDPNNAAKSHDDIAPLAGVETAVKALPAPANPPPSFGDTAMEAIKGFGGAYNKAAGSVNLVLGAFPTLYDKAASLITGKTQTGASDAWFKTFVDPTVAASPAFETSKNASFSGKALNMAGGMAGMLNQILLSAPAEAAAPATSVPELLGQVATHGTKSMAFPAISDSVATANKVYQETGDAGQAVRAAQMQYATTTMGGMIPLSAPGGLAARLAGGFASGMATGEVSRQGMNLVLPASMQQPFDLEGMVLSGMAGSIMGGTMGPHSEPAYHEVIRQTYAEAAKADRAEQGAQSLQAVSEMATASKTRGRDPEAFRQLVKNMTEDGNLQDVYISADKLGEVLNQSGVTVDQLAKTLPDVAAQLHEATMTDGDVRIPVEDYATHIAGGPVDAALLPHMKVDPDGMTHQEAQDYFAKQQDTMKAQAEQIVADKTVGDGKQAESQAIHDQILGQLNTLNRFNPEVNKSYAALMREYFTTQSERAGMTPTELFESSKLNVKGESVGYGLDQRLFPDPAMGRWDRDTTQRWELPFEKVKRMAVEGKITDQDAANIKAISKGDESLAVGKLEKLVKEIKKRPETAEAMLNQETRGAYNTDTGTLALLKAADLSTFLHESGHFFLETSLNLAAKPGASDSMRADAATLMDHFGIKDTADQSALDQWHAMTLDQKREGHETFARGFEQYLMEGKAPTLELQSMFGRFRSWLLNIYKSLSALNVQLSPEVRGVMDRMLASDEAIKGAEQTRGYKPLFETAPEGVTPEQWAAYQGLGKEATDQAVADMTSRSMKDMQWASNAKSRALKDLRRDASSKRKVIREEVTKEVDALPVYQAQEFIRANSGDVGHKKALADWRTDRDAQEATAKAETASKEERATRMAAWDDANPKPERARTPLDAWNDSRRAAEDAARETERARIGGGLKGLEKGQALAKNKRAIDNTVDRQMLDWESQNQKPGKFYAEVDKDIVAETHGFADKKDMQAAIDKAGPKKEMIEALTDQRMLEQHGELVDAQSIERAAEAAIHNEARAKFMATGLKILSKSPIPANQLAKAAKEAADAAIAAKRVMDLRPAQYSAAEAKANREAIKQAPKDPQAAVQAQRAALLNNRLFKAATDAVAEVKKTIDYVNKFNKDSIRAKIDVDIRDQIDDLMRRFDFRQTVPDGPTRKQMNLEKWIESQREAGYTPAFTADMIDPTVRMHYKEMSVEQLRGLRDTIAAMEHLGRERKSIIVNGQRVLVADLVHEQLVPKMQERGDNFTDSQLLDRPEDRHTNPIALALDKLGSRLRAIQAQLKPQEFKRNQYDNHELLGPFGAALFDRVFAANYHKVDMLKGLSDDFQAKATELGKDWQNSLNDQVANKRLMDPDRSKEGQPPVPMRISRGRMIGMALHVGNESNFDKLTKGWNWHPEDVWSFLHDNMGEKDWQAVKSVWDQYEKHFPEMQEMARRLGNTAPDKIEPRPFSTKFGELPGGYAAIKYDALRSRRGEKEAAGQAINPGDGLFNRNYFRADTTTNGSMNARVDGYTDRVDLDFHHIARTLHDSIHDLAYREALIDSNKLIGHPEFRTQFRKTYGPEAYLSLQDWVGRLANSENTDRAVGALGHFLSYTRTGIVMNGIALRASTVLKHGGSTGIKTTGYFLGGGEKYLASRFASMGTDYHGQIEGAKEKFPEIRARLLQQDRDYRAMSASLFEPESAQSKAERFGHAAVAWSDMMTAVPTAWAAYDRAITEGIPKNLGGTGVPMTEAQSVAYASKIVREAHGSNIESARSMALNTSSEALKMFTTLYGFMNNSYGQALDGFDKLRTAGISNPAILARSFMALIVPSLWAGYLVHGAPKDDEGWAAWIGKAIAGEVAGMVPFVRDVASMVEGYRSAGQVAAESWLSTMVKAGKDVKDLAQGNHVHAPIKDIANAAGMGLHIPGLGQIGTTAQYLADVHSGDQNPENAGQMVKDALLGPKR